jgi:hypothetical protein
MMNNLIECVECSAAVSNLAPRCPNCAAPTGHTLSLKTFRYLDPLYEVIVAFCFLYLLYSYLNIYKVCDPVGFARSDGILFYLTLVTMALLGTPLIDSQNFLPPDHCAVLLHHEKHLFIFWVIVICKPIISKLLEKIQWAVFASTATNGWTEKSKWRLPDSYKCQQCAIKQSSEDLKCIRCESTKLFAQGNGTYRCFSCGIRQRINCTSCNAHLYENCFHWPKKSLWRFIPSFHTLQILFFWFVALSILIGIYTAGFRR